MKNKKVTILFIICIVAMIIFAAVVISLNKSYEIVPNREKFEYNKDKYGSLVFEDSVGEGVYEIDHFRHPPALRINHANKEYYTGDLILEGLYEKCFENEILYYYSQDGFAIVYPESNLCKVLITPPPVKWVKSVIGGFRPEENNYCISKLEPEDEPENKFIVYIDSFDEFTPYEQKMLNSLVEKHKKKEAVSDKISGIINSVISPFGE